MANLPVEQEKQLKQTIGITVRSTYEEVGDSIENVGGTQENSRAVEDGVNNLGKTLFISSGMLVVAGELFHCFISKRRKTNLQFLKTVFPFKEKLIGLMMKFLYGSRGSDVIWVCVKIILSPF